jgi:uncharacterized protein RhaS with RHS repeats
MAENSPYQKDFAWDGKGRLSSVTDNEGLSVRYTYDPLDRTYSADEGGQLVTYAYDMTSDIEMAVVDQSLSINVLFTTGADGLISATTSQGTSYFSHNPHADTSVISAASGNVTSQLCRRCGCASSTLYVSRFGGISLEKSLSREHKSLP